MDLSVFVQAAVVAIVTAVITSWSNNRVLDNKFRTMNDEITRLRTLVHDLELLVAELKGRLK